MQEVQAVWNWPWQGNTIATQGSSWDQASLPFILEMCFSLFPLVHFILFSVPKELVFSVGSWVYFPLKFNTTFTNSLSSVVGVMQWLRGDVLESHGPWFASWPHQLLHSQVTYLAWACKLRTVSGSRSYYEDLKGSPCSVLDSVRHMVGTQWVLAFIFLTTSL